MLFKLSGWAVNDVRVAVFIWPKPRIMSCAESYTLFHSHLALNHITHNSVCIDLNSMIVSTGDTEM